jgi:hypothetical protein
MDGPGAVLVGLGVVVLLVVVVGAGTSAAAFDVFNQGWDGTSELRSRADDVATGTTVLVDTDQYASVPANDSVALVLSPETGFEIDEVGDVSAFVRRGGTLVVAEDFGQHGGALLAGVGASARFSGRLLRDERHNFRTPRMPVATNGSETAVTDAGTRLTLNHGTAVVPNGSTVGLTTSSVAYLDANRNGELDGDESVGAYPVVTVERVGQGRVVAVGDPSVFLNAMAGRSGNREFLRGLLAGRHVVFDASQSDRVPPLAYGVDVVRDAPLLQSALGVAVVLVVLGVATLPGGAGRRDGGLAGRVRRRSSTVITNMWGSEEDTDGRR